MATLTCIGPPFSLTWALIGIVILAVVVAARYAMRKELRVRELRGLLPRAERDLLADNHLLRAADIAWPPPLRLGLHVPPVTALLSLLLWLGYRYCMPTWIDQYWPLCLALFLLLHLSIHRYQRKRLQAAINQSSTEPAFLAKTVT